MTHLEQRGPQDRYRVNLSEEQEVRYWMYALGVSRETLHEAVESVGVKVNDVRAFLGKRTTRS